MWLSGSVGKGGRNNSSDVKVAQYLLSAYGRYMSPYLDVPRNGKVDNNLCAAISRFQKEVVMLRSPDGRIDANGKTLSKLEQRISISASVGESGVNHESDVFFIEVLLSLHGLYYLRSPCLGKMSLELNMAITSFQRDVVRLTHPDGRVDPGGRTFQALIGITAAGSGGGSRVPSKVKFLQFTSSTGCYSYATPREQWATRKTIESLQAAALKFSTQESSEFAVGHLSLSNGAVFAPHKSHRTGKNADLRPIRTDGARSPVTITDPKYDRAKTEALIKILREDPNLHKILFNDKEIYSKYSNVRYYAGHHNHLHLTYKQ